VTLAELSVVIRGNAAPLYSTLAGVRSALGGLASFAGGIGPMVIGALGLGGLASVAGIGAGLYKAFNAASELNATISKTGYIFGDQAAQITQAAREMADQFGVSQTEFIGAATTFGAVYKAMGQTRDQAARTGTELAKLAYNLSSFEGAGSSPEQAIQALTSALSGQFEPMRRYRVFLSETNVEEKARQMGLTKTGGKLSEAAKKQALLALIMEQTKDAQGDLARTAGESDNVYKKFTGTIENIVTTLGQALMPGFEAVLGVVTDVAGGIQARLGGSVEWIQGKMRGFALGVYDAYEALKAFGKSDYVSLLLKEIGAVFQWVGGVAVAALDYIEFGLYHFDDLLGLLALSVQEFGQNAFEPFRVLGENVGRLWAFVRDNWVTILKDMVAALVNASTFMFRVFDKLGTALFAALTGHRVNIDLPSLFGDAFKDLENKLPSLARPVWSKTEGARDEIIKHMADKEQKRLADRAKKQDELNRMNHAGAPTAKEGTPGEEAPAKAAKAKTEDLAAFAKSIQENLFGKGDAAKKTADNTGKLVDKFGALAAAVAKATAGMGVGAIPAVAG